MLFEYFTTRVINADIEVENIGDCAIRACNDGGECYYLLIETQLGICRIFTYGPAMPDFDLLPKSVNCSFKRINFNEGKLAKIIKEFLNSPYSNITSAEEIEKEELLEECKDIISYMKQSLNW